MPDEVKAFTAKELDTQRLLSSGNLVAGDYWNELRQRFSATIDARNAQLTAVYRECASLVCYGCRIETPFVRANWHGYPGRYTSFCGASAIREAHPSAFEEKKP